MERREERISMKSGKQCALENCCRLSQDCPLTANQSLCVCMCVCVSTCESMHACVTRPRVFVLHTTVVRRKNKRSVFPLSGEEEK